MGEKSANIEWHIGCSGFHYKEWKEVFYPKGLAQSKWLSYYATQFNTLEINNTFYRFPELSLFEGWYQRSPEGFHLSVKVPRIITHYNKFNGTETMLQDFYQMAKDGLKEKLGCILFQLPPQVQYSPDLLSKIIQQTSIFFQNVIEFRHISWWRKDVFQLLEEHSISFCGVSYPGLISDAIITGPVCYYRFHGVPKLYYSAYDTEFLKKIFMQITDSKASTAWVYFNNTASAAAIDNARTLIQMIKDMLNDPA